MVDVQTKLTDLREDAYAKVLKCLPYPRQWVRRCAFILSLLICSSKLIIPQAL